MFGQFWMVTKAMTSGFLPASTSLIAYVIWLQKFLIKALMSSFEYQVGLVYAL